MTLVVRLVYHLFVDEGLTLRRIAQRLAMLGQPTPSGGCQWQISTLHDWLRNPAAKGELYQLTHRAVAPKRRRKPMSTTASHSPFSSAELRPREEWYLVPVPPAVDENAWATAQRRLDQNRALARRNGRRAYLLSGLVTCESCGRRMTGFYRAATGKRFSPLARASGFDRGRHRLRGEGGHRARRPGHRRPAEAPPAARPGGSRHKGCRCGSDRPPDWAGRRWPIVYTRSRPGSRSSNARRFGVAFSAALAPSRAPFTGSSTRGTTTRSPSPG